jgi:hypothetical protein
MTVQGNAGTSAAVLQVEPVQRAALLFAEPEPMIHRAHSGVRQSAGNADGSEVGSLSEQPEQQISFDCSCQALSAMRQHLAAVRWITTGALDMSSLPSRAMTPILTGSLPQCLRQVNLRLSPGSGLRWSDDSVRIVECAANTIDGFLSVDG